MDATKGHVWPPQQQRTPAQPERKFSSSHGLTPIMRWSATSCPFRPSAWTKGRGFSGGKSRKRGGESAQRSGRGGAHPPCVNEVGKLEVQPVASLRRLLPQDGAALFKLGQDEGGVRLVEAKDGDAALALPGALLEGG